MSHRKIRFALVVCFGAWMACGSRDLSAEDDAALVDKSISVKAIAATPTDGEHLAECISSTLRPHAWEALGGPSTIKWQRGELVVSAPESVQTQITKLVEALGKLPDVNAKEAAATPKVLRINLGEADADQPQVTAVYPVADLLRGPAIASEALDQIVEMIESTVTPTDWAPIGDGHIASFASRGALVVTQTERGQEQIEALLAALRKAPSVTKEALDKPPKAVSIAAGSHMHFDMEFVTVAYPVADLVTDGKSARARVVNGATAKDFDFNSLAELITSCIARSTWDAVGGSGVAREFDPRLVLVVSHSKEVHKQVESLLAALRKLPRYSARPQRAAAAPPIPVGELKLRGATVHIVAYDVAGGVAARSDPDYDSLMENLYDIEPESWNVLLGIGAMKEFPSRGAIIIVQSKENHARILEAIKAFDPNKNRE